MILDSTRGVRTPPAQAVEGTGARVSKMGRSSTQPLTESQFSEVPTEENNGEATTKKVLDGVATLHIDQLDKLLKSNKYMKATS